MVQSKQVLVIPDTQIYDDGNGIAGIDLKSWKAVLKYASNHTWDEVVILGDFLDFNCISSHNAEKPRLVAGQSVTQDYAAGNYILDQLQAAVGKKTKITLLEGNHEYRYERMLDALPAFEGLMDVQDGLKLHERGIKYVRAWSKGEVYTIGKAHFIHGLATTKYHTAKMVGDFGTNIFYGHTHDIQTYSQVQKGDGNTIVGQSLGCLCVYDLPYMRGRASRWQQCITTFRFWDNGNFNYFISRIFEHTFISPEGKVYTP